MLKNDIDYNEIFSRVVSYFSKEYNVSLADMRDIIDMEHVVESWDNSYNTMFGTIKHMRPLVIESLQEIANGREETLSAAQRNRL